VTTESFTFKGIWTILIILTFAFGFQNISLSVTDYYKFDKITNVERVTPENVTFPAITFCSIGGYVKERYRNGLYINRENNTTERNESRIKGFLNQESTFFLNYQNKSNLSVMNHLDYFKANDKDDILDCIRFNAVTNKSVELFKANSVFDTYSVVFNNYFIEKISANEFFNYTFKNHFFYSYICDNHFNSIDKLDHNFLFHRKGYSIKIAKESIEVKLPEPYNHCKESSDDEYYHQSDCIETCIFKEIKDKYNCTYPLSLFEIQGLKQCSSFDYSKEFYPNCLKVCPLERCFSEKFTYTSVSRDSSVTEFYFDFSDLSTLNISQIPKTDSFTFLNNIGGGLGLFMGIAFPNLIEFIQFIFEIFLILIVEKIN
jgi:hypothetical protein